MKMRIEIVDRRKTLRDFNERNGTTNRHSSYVGVSVVDNGRREARLVFKHFNGDGRATYVMFEDGSNQLRGTRINDSYLD
jgi:hypothetical protein